MDKILSFDVSSVSTGWSLFSDEKLADCGTIKIPTNLELQDRLIWFKYHAHVLLLIYKPTEVIIEETYLKNVKTLKTLSQFIGVLNLVCGEVLEILPTFLNTNTVRSDFKLKTKEEAFDYVKSKYKVKFRDMTFENGNDITDSILQGLYWLKARKENE